MRLRRIKKILPKNSTTRIYWLDACLCDSSVFDGLISCIPDVLLKKRVEYIVANNYNEFFIYLER